MDVILCLVIIGILILAMFATNHSIERDEEEHKRRIRMEKDLHDILEYMKSDGGKGDEKLERLEEEYERETERASDGKDNP